MKNTVLLPKYYPVFIHINSNNRGMVGFIFLVNPILLLLFTMYFDIEVIVLFMWIT